MIMCTESYPSIPSWPSDLTLKRFIQHMTLKHEDLARSIVLQEHQVGFVISLRNKRGYY